jgi:Rab GDP dissociation inhibitor
MNETYDAIVLGTGLKECIISGLLAKMEGKKILQIDRNSYYGAESASLNLTNLWKNFREGKSSPKEYGENRDWNVDLIPKFVMSDGDLVKLLFKTKVHNYLEWKAIDGTYVYQWDKGGIFSNAKGVIHKVPSNDKEAINSDLMGLFEKNRCRKFFQFIQDFNADDPKTHDKVKPDGPFKDIIKKFGLEANTTDFVGHAVALYTNDNFLDEPSLKTINAIKLYMNSVGKYGDTPFIYPIYGLSGLAEGFSRLCALYGGTYMLNRDCDEILYDEEGKFKGIKSQGEVAFGKLLIADPTYIAKLEPKKVQSKGKIIRCICIMNHPIPKTKDMPSTQIIIPQKQVGRKNGKFISLINNINI